MKVNLPKTFKPFKQHRWVHHRSLRQVPRPGSRSPTTAMRVKAENLGTHEKFPIRLGIAMLSYLSLALGPTGKEWCYSIMVHQAKLRATVEGSPISYNERGGTRAQIFAAKRTLARFEDDRFSAYVTPPVLSTVAGRLSVWFGCVG